MNREVYRIKKAGSINHLKKNIEQLEKPQKNELQILVKAIGLNFADIFALTGLYSATPSGSFIPGLEFSGEITECGDNVDKYNIGDKVMGVTRFGAYADHLNCGEDYLFPVPEGWSFPQAAAFPVNALTAYYGLVTLGNVQKDQNVLIQSAAGGVGIMANRIAKKLSARTTGTVSNPEKIDQIKNEKYDRLWVRDKDYFKSLKKAADKEKFDLVLEAIGGKVFKTAYESLGPQGKIVTMGAAQFTPRGDRADILRSIYLFLTRPRIDPLEMISENKSVMGFNLIWLWSKAAELRKTFDQLSKLDLEPPIIKEQFSFSELPQAIRRLRTGETVGKVVVQVN